jgi:hypothetical protein
MHEFVRRKILHAMAGRGAGGSPKDRVRKDRSVSAVPLEHAEQVGFINWFRDRFPAVLIFAIPNGDHRAISTAKRLKAEGVTAGIPDMYVPAWNLWIEMKRSEGGRLAGEQRGVIDYLQSVGHYVIIGKGAKDASRQVLMHLENMAADKRDHVSRQAHQSKPGGSR